jgi:hypothetical protein
MTRILYLKIEVRRKLQTSNCAISNLIKNCVAAMLGILSLVINGDDQTAPHSVPRGTRMHKPRALPKLIE